MLPELFLSRMEKLLGAEYLPFLASYDQPPSIGLRVNTLKLSPETFVKMAPFELSPISWVPAGFTLPYGERPGKHPYHTAGLYYLQDPAAQAVAEVLDPQPGERILDLSAAPGGKSTHIAALMQGEGLLVTNDIHPKRVRDLAKNIERWGARNVVILNETPARLADHFGAYFDKVLVDAPCSGEGMFRKDSDARGEWTPKLVESCAVRQDAILSDAARLVRPGGRLVYSTCTFAPEEDEGTIARFLDSHADFEIAPIPMRPGYAGGRGDWLPERESGLATSGAEEDVYRRTIRIWPHTAPGEGHYIAVCERTEGDELFSERPSPFRPGRISAEAQGDFDRFMQVSVEWTPPNGRLALLGAYWYLLPKHLPDLRGLRVVHWGWWLGSAKKKRFEPAHAFGMGLQATDLVQTLALTADEQRTRSYLHGEVLETAGANGWVLVTVDGFPLGWGKRVNNRLKTHLPSWLRMM